MTEGNMLAFEAGLPGKAIAAVFADAAENLRRSPDAEFQRRIIDAANKAALMIVDAFAGSNLRDNQSS